MVGLAVRLRALGSDLPRRAAELVAAQFDTVAAMVEGCDALVANGMMPAGVWQNRIERILAGWVGELGVPIYRGREVKGFAQDNTGVDVELADSRRCGRNISSGATEDAV